MSNEESKSLSYAKQRAEELRYYPSYRVRHFIKRLNAAFNHLAPDTFGATKRTLFSPGELVCLAQCLNQHLATSELRMLSTTLAGMLTERSGSLTS